MNTVFIGGSRKLSRVSAELAHRLDNIIQKNMRVHVGDANGFDRAAQKYLADRQYGLVVVYCTNGQCRNNVGNWPVHVVAYPAAKHDRAFYTAKDDAMIRDSDFGLFAWDGKSEGTIRNLRKMAEQGKASWVYVSQTKKLMAVLTTNDLSAISSQSDDESQLTRGLFSETAPSADPANAK